MDTPSDTLLPPTPRRWFYGVAVLMMLIGVATAVVQKGRENAVAVTVAKRIASGVQETEEHWNNVRQIIQDAKSWRILSLVIVSLAIVSWGIAAGRGEKCRGIWIIIVSLLALFVAIELIMV
jgi:hypothetical protein